MIIIAAAFCLAMLFVMLGFAAREYVRQRSRDK